TPSPAPKEESSFPLAVFIAIISAALAVVIGTTILVRRGNKYRVVPDVLASAMAEAEADDRFASQPSSSSLSGDENYQERMRAAREVVNPFKRFAKQREEQQRAQARRLEKAKREREEKEKERREMKKEKEKREEERARAQRAQETAKKESEAARSKKVPESAASNDGKPSSASAEQAYSEDLGASAELSAVRELRCELEKSKADEPHRKRKQRFKKLQLEWHPDKNRSDEATAVFQFLQSKKSWYLGK
ncbi:hypothetical protein FOZ60_001086, partial [Perkinsus olseni]